MNIVKRILKGIGAVCAISALFLGGYLIVALIANGNAPVWHRAIFVVVLAVGVWVFGDFDDSAEVTPSDAEDEA